MNENDLEELIQALRYAMLLVGMREANFPVGAELGILISYITKYYGGHTAREIRLAFEMALSGQLGEVKVETFENFSVEYFSRIMNAYRKWAASEVQQHMEEPYIQKPAKWQVEAEYCRALLMDKEQKEPLRYLTNKNLLT